MDNFREELRFAGDRLGTIERLSNLRSRLEQLKQQSEEADLLLKLERKDLELVEITGRAAKKNFAQRLSLSVAQKVADALRSELPSISPDAMGKGHESLSAGAGGLKKLDVNFSTPQSGLELAVSIKTINFRDEGTQRYTKNARRVDGELRAEAQDCHKRQPYAVLVAVLLVPREAAFDAKKDRSSLNHLMKVLQKRSGRHQHDLDASLFEAIFVGPYSEDGDVHFFSVDGDIPDQGLPSSPMPFSDVIASILRLHRSRNPN